LDHDARESVVVVALTVKTSGLSGLRSRTASLPAATTITPPLLLKYRAALLTLKLFVTA
jgi:hypothetical protein